MNCTYEISRQLQASQMILNPVHWSIIPELRSSQLTIHAYKLCGETLAWLMATRRQSRVRRAHCWALLLLVGVPSRSARSPICLSYVICICKLPQPAYGCGGGIYMGMEWYGSVPINTIFNGMNIHKSQLFWCEQKGTRLWHTAIEFYIPFCFSRNGTPGILRDLWQACGFIPQPSFVPQAWFDDVWCGCPDEKKNHRHHGTS